LFSDIPKNCKVRYFYVYPQTSFMAGLSMSQGLINLPNIGWA